jgi:hypothetical protein
MSTIKISQLPAKGANLEATDLVEISEFDGSGYVSKSITGQEIIDGASGGGVTDVTATAPLSSSGGSTPDISIPAANVATDGYLKSIDYQYFSTKQEELVSGVNIKTLNGGSLLGSGGLSVQPTLVSGTNIKTINGSSVLGSGDLTISGGGGLQGIHSILPLYSGEITAPNLLPYASISGSAFVADRMVAYPYIPNQNITTSSLLMSCNSAIAGSSCRIYIYSNSTTSNYPNSLLFSSSDISTATTGTKYALTTFNFVAGTTYWLVFHGGTIAGAAHHMAVGYMMPIRNTTSTNYANSYYGNYSFALGAPSTFPSSFLLQSVNVPYIGIQKA